MRRRRSLSLTASLVCRTGHRSCSLRFRTRSLRYRATSRHARLASRSLAGQRCRVVESDLPRRTYAPPGANHMDSPEFLYVQRGTRAGAAGWDSPSPEPPRDPEREVSESRREASGTRVIDPAPNVARCSEVLSTQPCVKTSRSRSVLNDRAGRQRTGSDRVQSPAYSTVSVAKSARGTYCPGAARAAGGI